MTQVGKYEQKRTQKYFEPSNKKFNLLRENNPTLGDNGMLQGPQKMNNSKIYAQSSCLN